MISPFDWRYGSGEVRALFTPQAFVDAYVEVEKALACALEELGVAERGCCQRLEGVKVAAEEVYRLEREVGHDILSLVILLEQRSGCRYVHYGATSNDVIDTAWALLIRRALSIIKKKINAAGEELARLARRYKGLVMVGRTHGQWAEPITLGFKFANYYYELYIACRALAQAEELIRAKVGGAVGTMAAWGELGPEVRRRVAERLGLPYHVITTQVAPRESYAALASALAVLAAVFERLATEIRELSRPEIGEVVERGGGSSAMPHKANPTASERVVSLARYVRALVNVALENVALWHERDLTNSANERVWIPEAILAVDEILDSSVRVLRTVEINEARIEENLQKALPYILTEFHMIRMVREGMPRYEAYRRAKEVRDITYDFERWPVEKLIEEALSLELCK
ncbi:adenylosuccinate lyase [Pyrobaculum neutrophilum]|uniref:Adenylosuccinate lyase n=1 Tax=Pyrobaculum neutrophilum (strain DSM 2338 / JCM 9278 / NBRC 100436 / V24Sta) TaxID=444157 RepID=B1YAM5_PYRNV|nr:adenylosuccinate lyase [Pyrobaculum neutrophilum]ACB39104.1 adenylosuccinate lyase [Pyrobaculum neutrophilum V24Sta]